MTRPGPALGRFFENLRRDAAYGLRSFRRSPGPVAVALLSLTLGAAGATAFFTVANTVLFRPRPHVVEPDRLVAIYTMDSAGRHLSASYPDLLDIRTQADSLAGVAAVGHADPVVGLSSGEGRHVICEQVSANYLDLLGATPSLGRFFTEEDLEAGLDVAVLGHGFWERELNADPGVQGRTLFVDGRPHTVVGVAPAGFIGRDNPAVIDLWIPVDRSWRQSRGTKALQLVGRMGERVRIEQVQAQLTLIAGRLAEENPVQWHDFRGEAERLVAIPDRLALIPPDHRAEALVAAALLVVVILMVLLIACSNLANLMLGRALDRRREMAMRLALGAARGRLIAQLLTESLVLAGMAVTVGFGLIAVLARLLATGRWPGGLPLAIDVQVDWRVGLFGLALACGTALAFGLVPAVQASRPEIVPALKGEEGPGRRRFFSLRNLLVMAQVAGSVVLVAGAALLLRSFDRIRSADLGFETERVALVEVDLSPLGLSEEEGRALFDRMAERARALPGVEGIVPARTVLLGPVMISAPGIRPGDYELTPGEYVTAGVNVIGPGYFDLLRIPILRGREFADTDVEGAPEVILVNRTLAERFWPGQDPIGKQLEITEKRVEIVGVVGDGRYRDVLDGSRPCLWYPFGQSYDTVMTFHAKSSGDPRALLPLLREEARALHPRLPLPDTDTLEGVVESALVPHRVLSAVLGGISAVSLGIAMLGIYGVLAFAVSRRTREIGIRMALGAEPRRVVAMILGQGLRMSAAGLAVGLAILAGLSGLVRSVLAGVSPLDPLSLGGSAALLILACAFSSLPAARRAARVDPVESLRAE